MEVSSSSEILGRIQLLVVYAVHGNMETLLKVLELKLMTLKVGLSSCGTRYRLIPLVLQIILIYSK